MANQARRLLRPYLGRRAVFTAIIPPRRNQMNIARRATKQQKVTLLRNVRDARTGEFLCDHFWVRSAEWESGEPDESDRTLAVLLSAVTKRYRRASNGSVDYGLNGIRTLSVGEWNGSKAIGGRISDAGAPAQSRAVLADGARARDKTRLSVAMDLPPG